METPRWDLESCSNVYEPSEDSFLLLDVLESDLQTIRNAQPRLVLEIGSGSGIIITAVAKELGNTAHCLAIDINKYACQMTQKTSHLNSAQVDVIHGDLTSCIKSAAIDLIVFNPPYVVTSDNEVSEGSIQRAWAGGTNGRIVIDRLLLQLENILSHNALFYIVLIKENKPEEIIEILKLKGFSGKEIASRKIRGEHLFVLRFSRFNS